MTTVAAANAEPAALNRARQAVADPAPIEDSSSDGSQAFAAVLTATRQTTLMLRRLLDQRVDRISSSHQRRQQASEAVTPGEDRQAASETEAPSSTRAETRTDRSASPSERDRTARRTSSSEDDSTTRVGNSDAAGSSRNEEYPVVSPDRAESAPVTATERQDAETAAGGSGYADGSLSQASGTQPVTQQASHIGQARAETASASPVPGVTAPSSGGTPFAQTSVVSGPETAPVTTQQTAVVAGASTFFTPNESGTQTNSGNGSASELGQSGATAKAGQVAAKAGTAPAEFQSLLQQAGRARSAMTADAAASAKAGAATEETVLDPSRAESIEKLARVLRSQLGTRNSTMTLRLDPPELGSLRVEVRMQDQTLTLKIQADTQAGQNALHSRLDTLRQALEQQGVRVEQMTVEYRPQAGDSTQQSRDGSNPSSYDGSQSGNSGGFGQAQEQGRGMQESYASAGFARWSDASLSDEIGQQEILTIGAGSMSASAVDLIA